MTDTDLGSPIEDALVVVGGRSKVLRTDAEGRFAAEGLCPPSTTLTVSKAGFLSKTISVSVPSPSLRSPIRIELGFAMQSVTIVAPLADPLADLGFADSLEGEALAATRGLSLGDALSRTAGVQVLRSGAVNKPVIDGFFGNRILILTDGLRHHSQLWSLDHAPEIDPFGADRLTVVRGAEGVRYGADAIGGVILVEPPAFLDPSEAGLQGEANLVGISNGWQGIGNLRLVSTVPGAPRWSVRAQGSFKKSGTLSAPDYLLNNTQSQDLSVSGGARYLGRGWQAEVSASYISQRYGIFTGLRAASLRNFEDAIALGEPRNVEAYFFSYEIDRAFTEVDHTFIRGQVQVDLSPKTRLDVTYGFQFNDRREFDIPRIPTDEPQLTFDLLSHAIEVGLHHRLGERFVGLFGVSGLLQTNDHEGIRLIPDYDRWVGGIFALERYQGDNIEVAIGLRYERQGLDTEQPARVAPNRNPPDRFSLEFEALMATLGASFTPDPAWRFDLHVAAGSRIPTIDELFIDGLVPGEVYFIEGDRDLRPERTINVGLGIAYANDWLQAEATGYVHRIADYIYRAPRLDENGNVEFEQLITGLHPALEYLNVEALYAGGNVALTVTPLDWLELKSQATYVRARDLSQDNFLVNIPPDRYQTRLTFLPLKALDSQLWIESVFVARQNEFDINADFAPPPDAYHLLNVGGSASFQLVGHRLRVSLDIQNLLNTAYRDYLSRLRFFADEPGFSAILRVSLPFSAGFDAPGPETPDR